MARHYGMGEEKPDNVCIADGCGRRKKRSAFGTCGRQNCIEKVNNTLKGAGQDNRDPSAGRKVKLNGKWHDVKNSGTNRHGHFVRLKDGHTVSLDDVEAWKD